MSNGRRIRRLLDKQSSNRSSQNDPAAITDKPLVPSPEGLRSQTERYREQITQVANQLVLPPGYEVVVINDNLRGSSRTVDLIELEIRMHTQQVDCSHGFSSSLWCNECTHI